MVQDARWPALPLMALRGIQLFFTILVLGMSGYLVSASTYSVFWGFSMTLTAAVFTLVYVIINFVLFFMNLLLPLAIVIVDAVITVFWVIALGGLGDTNSLPLSCTVTSYWTGLSYINVTCRVTKAAFGISFLIFLSFVGTLVLASIILHKNRKDLRGAKYNSGLDPTGNPLPQFGAAVAVDNVQQGAPASAYYQEPKPDYAPPPQAPTPVYYDYQHSVVSPPATPAPYMPPQMPHQGMPQPPPNAAEMPGR